MHIFGEDKEGIEDAPSGMLWVILVIRIQMGDIWPAASTENSCQDAQHHRGPKNGQRSGALQKQRKWKLGGALISLCKWIGEKRDKNQRTSKQQFRLKTMLSQELGTIWSGRGSENYCTGRSFGSLIFYVEGLITPCLSTDNYDFKFCLFSALVQLLLIAFTGKEVFRQQSGKGCCKSFTEALKIVTQLR